MKYLYHAVERIPDQLRDGVVYHSEEFELAALLCACGCGHRIILLVPDCHQITSEGGMATIRPSIGVCDAVCKSHYFITAGEIEWLPSFTGAQATLLMQRQIARHVALDTKPKAWRDRLSAFVQRVVNGIKSLLRIFRR